MLDLSAVCNCVRCREWYVLDALAPEVKPNPRSKPTNTTLDKYTLWFPDGEQAEFFEIQAGPSQLRLLSWCII